MDSQDTLKILLSTDNHVGYLEGDPLRGQDSFITFEEILQIAIAEEVDMVLLGGDFFHENVPSRRCLHQTLGILQKYCLGEKPCYLEYLGDPETDFPSASFVNYENPNLNIGLPVFSIHGNHDDPSGPGNLCALDLLSVTGLVNYFGRQSKIDDISVSPILLKKGQTRLALYGLGNIRDLTLYRSFADQRVKMARPENETQDWFNLLVLHQNRTPHSPKNFIPESFLASFLHFIVWGHEHECLIDPSHNSERAFYVTQPGSSIATSLCEGESKTKHIGILSITGQEWDLKKIRLKTVRPFVIDDIELKTVSQLEPGDSSSLMLFLHQRVEQLIHKAIAQWKSENPDAQEDSCPKPLVRLKVEYSGGFSACNPQRFGQAFVSKIANPQDVIQFYRKRQAPKPKSVTEPDLPDAPLVPAPLEKLQVADLVNEFLGAQHLGILPENLFHDAVNLFADKDDKDAIREFMERSLEKTRMDINMDRIDLDDEAEEIETQVAAKKKEQFDKYESGAGLAEDDSGPSSPIPVAQKTVRSKPVKKRKAISEESEAEEDLGHDIEEDAPAIASVREPSPIPVRKTSSLRRTITKSSSVSAPSKRSRATVILDDEDEVSDTFIDEEEGPEPPAPIKKPRGRPTVQKKEPVPATAKKPPTPKGKKKASMNDWIPSRQTKLNFSQSLAAPMVIDDDEEESRNAFQSITNSLKSNRKK